MLLRKLSRCSQRTTAVRARTLLAVTMRSRGISWTPPLSFSKRTQMRRTSFFCSFFWFTSTVYATISRELEGKVVLGNEIDDENFLEQFWCEFCTCVSDISPLVPLTYSCKLRLFPYELLILYTTYCTENSSSL